MSNRNAPYVFGARSIATALATGNTTVIKASEMTPRSYWAMGKVFHDAGVPAGVLNIISCPPSNAADLAKAMVEHPAVKKINFTGSASVGRKVARLCSDNLKPILLELGGKNSAIILPDADLETAAKACIMGGFANVRRFPLDWFTADAPGRANLHVDRSHDHPRRH